MSNPMINIYARQLKMPTLRQYADVVRLAEEKGLNYEDFLSEILVKELRQREENQHKRRIATAGFPLEKSLDTFEFNRLQHVEEAIIWQLASGEFVSRKENVILIGNPGTGKTHLAIGLGRRLCAKGYRVRFYTASKLVTELTEARDEYQLTRLTSTLKKTDLLILDELSYLSFDRQQAELLFHVLSERNERGSVMITTNLEFSRWEEIFPDSMLTAALVDRLTHRAHILNMNGDSYRLLERLKKTEY